MKKNGLYGFLIAIVMLFCSASYAFETPTLTSDPAYDSFVTKDIGAGSAGVLADKPNNDGIGRMRTSIVFVSAIGKETTCMTTRNKVTDNTLAYNEKPLEIGWRL